MRNVLSNISNLLIVGFFAGAAGLSDAHANTSAEEVLKDIAIEDMSETTTATEDEAVTSEDVEVKGSEELDATPQAVETPANDYGDAVLNQLYNE